LLNPTEILENKDGGVSGMMFDPMKLEGMMTK